MKPEGNVPARLKLRAVGKTTAGRSEEPAAAIHCFRLFLTMERATAACGPAMAPDSLGQRPPNVSPAGLTRGSIFLRNNVLAKKMDCRVKPGNDGL